MAWNMLPISALTFWNTGGLGRGGPKEGTSSRAVTDTCGAKTNVIAVGAAGQGIPQHREVPLLEGGQRGAGDALPSPAQSSRDAPAPESQGAPHGPRPARQTAPPQPSSIITPAFMRELTMHAFYIYFLRILFSFVALVLLLENREVRGFMLPTLE